MMLIYFYKSDLNHFENLAAFLPLPAQSFLWNINLANVFSQQLKPSGTELKNLKAFVMVTKSFKYWVVLVYIENERRGVLHV